jgi:hypothetical protein
MAQRQIEATPTLGLHKPLAGTSVVSDEQKHGLGDHYSNEHINIRSTI